jgi:serine O-acetyltransferase
MTLREYKYLVLSDLYRLTGQVRIPTLLLQLIMGGAYKHTFWFRTARFTAERAVLRKTVHPLARLILRRYAFKLGIVIPYHTNVGSGLYIGHFGGIVVSEKATIGRNCSISHGVTIGKAPRGNRAGYPTLGDNVYLAPGSKVIGNVRVGNNVAIGANCVVTKDVPDNAVVAGVPARVLSYQGSDGYVTRTDYDRFLRARMTWRSVRADPQTGTRA